MEMIRTFILGMGFFELFFIVLALLVGPLSLWWYGTEELHSRFGSSIRGILSIICAIALVPIDIALAVLFGKDIWYHISSTFSSTMKGILIAVVVCILLFPFGYMGSMFRALFKAWKIVRADPSKRIKRGSLRNTFLSILFILLIMTSGFVFLPIKVAILLSGSIGFALMVGWFGSIIVPDIGG